MLPGLLRPHDASAQADGAGGARSSSSRRKPQKLIDLDGVTREAHRARRAERHHLPRRDRQDRRPRRRARARRVSREGVQRDLLPIVEGTTVNTKYGMVQDRPHALHRRRRVPRLQAVGPDPRAAGPVPDPRRARAARRHDFVRILTEPKSALIKQYTALLATEGVHARVHATTPCGAIARAGALRSTSDREHRRAPPAHGDGTAARRGLLRRAGDWADATGRRAPRGRGSGR